MSKRNGLVLAVVFCAVLALGFVAGNTMGKTPAPPYTLTALPQIGQSPGYSTPTFLLTDSQSPMVKLVTVRYADQVDAGWASPFPKLEDNRMAFIVLAEFDLTKLPAGGAAGEPAANSPPAKP
jgi:hypothetical protein